MTYQIENEYLTAEFSEAGGEMIRLRGKKNGTDYLWSGDPAHWKYHSPVLFPFVGKHAGGAFRFEGKVYPMGQHGFARTSTFTLREKTEDSISFVLTSDEETRKIYPFDFELVLTYTLRENCMDVEWTVNNPSSEQTLYFQIGAHPAFNVPSGGRGRKEDWSVVFPDDQQHRYILIDLNEGAADPDHEYLLETGSRNEMPLRKGLFDIDTFIFDNGQISETALMDPDGNIVLKVKSEGFPFYGIWSPSDEAPFVCLEPWYGRIDDRGFNGDITQKKGIQKLECKETFHACYTIEITEIKC